MESDPREDIPVPQDGTPPNLSTGSVAEPPSPYAPRPAEKAPELPAPHDYQQLRLATFAILQNGIPLEVAARKFGVDPDSLHIWHRTYLNFIGKQLAAVTGSGTPDRVELDAETRQRFDENWAEMMRIAELERPQLSLMRKRLLRFPLTRWMFHGEKIDHITITGAVAVVAFSILAIRAGTSYRGTNSDEGETRGDPLGTDLSKIEIGDSSTFPPEQQQAIVAKVAEALKKFIELDTWQERLPHVRHPDAINALMAEYYERHADGPISGLQLGSSVSFVSRADGNFVLLQGRFIREAASPEKAEPIVILAELIEEEPGVLFDWEILVNHEPLSWPEFVASKARQASPFRVRVRRGDYYNQPFMDSSESVCFEMLLLHRNEKIYGYVPRGTKLAKEMENMIAKELVENRAMTLNLRYPENAKFDDILEIESIVTDGWLGN